MTGQSLFYMGETDLAHKVAALVMLASRLA
jgi:hypothetical protein